MRHSKTSLVTAAILSAGLSTVALEQKVMAQELTTQTNQIQHLGAVVRAPGIGGALWGTETTFTNHSDSPSETLLVITPHGASASPEDFSKQLVLGPGESITLNDVIGEPDIAGSYSVAATTTVGEKPAITALIKNTQQYGNDSSKKTVLLMYQQSFDDNDFMLPGDRSIINIPQNNLYYMNARIMGKMIDGDTQFPVVRISGHVNNVKMCEYEKELTNGGVIQIVKTNATAECPANNYTHFTFQQMRGKGLVEASIVYQNPDLAGANDAGIERAIKKALLEEFTVGISPNKAEVGDNLTLAGYARGRPGTTVTGMAMGWRPKNAVYQTDGNTSREVLFNKNATANKTVSPASGDTSNTPYAITTVIDEDGNAWGREITGRAVPVTEALPYIVPADVAKPLIRANLVALARASSYGLYDGTCLSEADAQLALDYFTDGNNVNGEIRGGVLIDKRYGVVQWLDVNGSGINKTISHLPGDSIRAYSSVLPKTQ